LQEDLHLSGGNGNTVWELQSNALFHLPAPAGISNFSMQGIFV